MQTVTMPALPDNQIVHALLLDGAGGARPMEADEIPAYIAAGEPVWVHLEARYPDTPQWLAQHLPTLDRLMIDALVAEETRPRAIEHEDMMLLFLRGVNLNENAEPEDMVSIRMCIGEKFCISLRRRPLKAASDIVQRLHRGNGPHTIPDLVNDLAGALFDRMEPVLSELDNRTDDLEELVADNPDAAMRHEIVSLRKRAIMLRRYLAPQRDAIGRLRTMPHKWLDEGHRRHLYEHHDQLTRFVEDLDTVRERSQIIQDELTTALSDRLNRNLYLLSIVAAIFLPLGFLTGLLGINVGGIPGTDSPYAFGIFSALLVLLVAFQLIIFRRLRWI